MLFYLGVHKPAWLAEARVPLFISFNTIGGVKKLPRAAERWALDSGAYSQMKKGGWTTTARSYAGAIARLRQDVGNLDWAAPQDWLCDADSLKATGKTVAQHQKLTLESYLELRSFGAPVIPVLQGWTHGDYIDHANAYEKAGVKLRHAPLVGVGTIKTRQKSTFVALLLAELKRAGVRTHGFGMSLAGFEDLAAHSLASADSMAWSAGQMRRPDEGGPNALRAALVYREQVVVKLERMGVSVTNGGVVTAGQIVRGAKKTPPEKQRGAITADEIIRQESQKAPKRPSKGVISADELIRRAMEKYR